MTNNNWPKHLEGHACPRCGKETLETQSEVIWCGGRAKAGQRPCMFGLDGEKTLADLPTAKAA